LLKKLSVRARSQESGVRSQEEEGRRKEAIVSNLGK
jgi:hypothetical protein